MSRRTEPCQNGPVRIVIDRAGRESSRSSHTSARGRLAGARPGFGTVSGQQAADFLLDVAARTEGRVGRDAIFASTLADSATTDDS